MTSNAYKEGNVSSSVYKFIVSKTMREAELLQQLREETSSLGEIARMQISPDEGQFLQTMVHLTKARKIIEVGVFTGYSSLAMALALPKDGKIVACDVSKEWSDIARRYWKAAGVESKIDLRIAPAQETLATLLESEVGTYDLAFIDADKLSYATYYEQTVGLLKPGGCLLVDNMLWDGKVADPEENDDVTRAIRALHAIILNDSRVKASTLSLADGVTIVVKL